MRLSIVVPFYNEEKNIPLVLEAFAAQPTIASSPDDMELICVNDGSKDSTAAAFADLERSGRYPFARFISYSPNGGYGNAIMTGVRAARGEVIAWTHSDMQTDPSDVFRAFDAYSAQNDPKVIMKGVRINRPLPQVIFSHGMSAIASMILRIPLFEINAQPKLFSKEFAEELKNAPKDFSLDLYALYQAKRKGYTIKTIDVEFRNRMHGESSWGGSFRNRVKTVWRTLKYIWKLNP